MKRRRRTLLLLALVPLSLGAGAIGYWRHTSQTSAVADDGPIEPHVVARRTYVVDGDYPSIPSGSPSHSDHAGAGAPDSWAEYEYPQSTPEQTEFEPSFSDMDAELFAANFSGSDFGAGAGATGYGHDHQARGGSGGAKGGAGSGSNGGATGSSQHSSNDQSIKGGYFDSTPSAQEHPGGDQRLDNPYDPHPQPPVDPTMPGGCSPPWCVDPHDPYAPVDEHWSPHPGTSPDAKPHVSVPEPSSLGLLSIGLLGILATRRRAARH